MAADEFVTTAEGATAREAFRNAVEDAQYAHGHSGHTGTIAEKDEYKMVLYEIINPEAAEALAYDFILDENHFTYDKWGPAGCIQVGPTTWMFFGTASS